MLKNRWFRFVTVFSILALLVLWLNHTLAESWFHQTDDPSLALALAVAIWISWLLAATRWQRFAQTMLKRIMDHCPSRPISELHLSNRIGLDKTTTLGSITTPHRLSARSPFHEFHPITQWSLLR